MRKYYKECGEHVLVYPGVEVFPSSKKGMIRYEEGKAKIISPGNGVRPFLFLVPHAQARGYHLKIEAGEHKYQKVYVLRFPSGVIFRGCVEGMAKVVSAEFHQPILMKAASQNIKCEFCVARLEGFPRPKEGDVITATYSGYPHATRQSITCRVVDGELIAEDVSSSYMATHSNGGEYRLIKVY